MKTLQNNFTTPEQSKRLLELGVPADSADCYWHPKERRNNKSRGYWSRPIILEDGHTVGYEQSYSAYFKLLPCWTLGRLIEIELMCREEIDGLLPRLSIVYGSASYIEELIRYMERRDHKYNFNKLED